LSGRLSKWIIPILLVGCQLEPEVVYVPEIIHDTTYVSTETSFSLATAAKLYMSAIDTVRLVYWYSLTKLDSVPIDSVFLTGYLHEWDSFRTSANMMDSTRVEHLGVMGTLVFLCCMLIYKFVNTDKKVEAMHRRFDSLKDHIIQGMEDTKDEISELNKDLLRQFRNNGR
jgi:hypothetical protein